MLSECVWQTPFLSFGRSWCGICFLLLKSRRARRYWGCWSCSGGILQRESWVIIRRCHRRCRRCHRRCRRCAKKKSQKEVKVVAQKQKKVDHLCVMFRPSAANDFFTFNPTLRSISTEVNSKVQVKIKPWYLPSISFKNSNSYTY